MTTPQPPTKKTGRALFDACCDWHKKTFWGILSVLLLIIITCQTISYFKLGKLLPPWSW